MLWPLSHTDDSRMATLRAKWPDFNSGPCTLIVSAHTDVLASIDEVPDLVRRWISMDDVMSAECMSKIILLRDATPLKDDTNHASGGPSSQDTTKAWLYH